MNGASDNSNRREVASRNKKIFHRLASQLVNLGLTPNQVSVMSSVFAALGAWSLCQLPSAESWYFYLWNILALVGIQMRLVCNLIDGLMAVESGLKTPTGEIFNDFPDRVSDILLFLAVGFAAQSSLGFFLGWSACLLAVLTAYVRVLGASMGAGHFFSGPMAKQHRMFTLNIALIAAAVEWHFSNRVNYSFNVALGLICVGSLFTIFRRLQKIGHKLNH